MDVAAPSETEIKQIQKIEQIKLTGPTLQNNPAIKTGPSLLPSMKGPSANGAAGAGSGFKPGLGTSAERSNGSRLNKMSTNQVSGSSIAEKKVADNFLRPMALKEKTLISLAQQKANPRPPSSSGKKDNRNNMQSILAKDSSGGDEYSDEQYEENFEQENAEEDLKLEKLRKAMARENIKAAKVVTKANIVVKKDEQQPKKILKMGPSTGKGLINVQQLNMEARPIDPTRLIMPG